MSDNNLGAEHGALPPLDSGGATTPTRVPTVLGIERNPVQLAQVIGGQYIITSQAQQNVPPLTQITSTQSSTPVTRIIGISSIRSSLSLPSTISSQSIVNALTKPRPSTARTQLFPGESSGESSNLSQHRTPASSSTNTRKRSRADELPPGCENLTGNRARAMEHKWARSKCIKESYYEHIAELYFLETSGNMLDYYAWRKKPRTNHYVNYLTKHQLDASDLSQEDTPLQSAVTAASNISRLSSPKPEISSGNITSQNQSVVLATPITQTGLLSPKLEGTRFLLLKPTINLNAKNIAFVTTSNTRTTATTKESAETKVPETPSLTPLQVSNVATTTVTNVSSTVVTSTATNPKNSTTPASGNMKKSIVTAIGSGNQEQIVEKAKQEAYVMQRIAELQKDGLWSERRLPKVQETQRNKSHWDYLLEEMVWLAADFAQERKWKKVAAKKCAKMVQKYFQDKAVAAQKAEKAQELQLRRIASFIAKEIKTFWSNVEKIVEFKQQTILEEKRKKALDQQLSFIVDQTEKYSQLLAKDMNKSVDNQSMSINSSRVPSPHSDDDEFRPDDNSSDDEETIAQAEAAEAADQSKEVEALQRESEMNLDELNLKDYLENRDKIKLSDSEDDEDEKSSTDSKKKSKDDEFTIDSDAESEDIEDTIKEQEDKEGKVDHQKEIDELQAENAMSIEELMKKYSAPLPQEDDKMSVSEKSSESEESSEETEESDEEESSNEDENVSEDDEEDKVGLKSLLEDSTADKTQQNEDGENLINDVAAIAESIQPKGNTLSSTNVVTPVPFLLKHTLREYQHIGLDWLVTMFERKLNGILADEMGLGKTIQTIALLAHLACVKGDWGPHLIIVPTSVMLNWEMEFKKWCPGFKILTYYGTQKERKMKRTGWTKVNAFHICITSYKLVIQDHQSFRRKKWKYLILDEAQNIKNFKSQRWQLLLNFQTQQRLLLTGTPLQNNLMELWSLMHFLMPNVFQSHREFREWFSNPVTGMIEGNSEYNESIIKRLHKVLRPFLLRRLKSEVEKQMPKKFEHVIMCRLSKRQRFLYDDYMSRAKTKETLASGNLLSVINVLMQLRKVCNHPNLFEVRPTTSPFQMEGIIYNIPSLVYKLLDHKFFDKVDLNTLHFQLMNLEYNLTAYGAYRTCKYRAPTTLIEMIDTQPEPAPKCPKGLVRMKVKLGEPSRGSSPSTGVVLSNKPNTPEKIHQQHVKVATSPGLKFRVTGPAGQTLQGYSVQLVQHQGSVKAIPVATLATGQQAAVSTASLAIKPVGTAIKTEQRVSVGSFAQLVQTPMGKHILLTQSAALPTSSTVAIAGTTAVMTSSGQRLTVLSKPVTAVTTPLSTSPQKPFLGVNSSSPVVTTPGTPELATNSLDSTSSPTISRPLTATLVKQLREQAPNTPRLALEEVKREENIVEDKPNSGKQAYMERVQQCRTRKLNILVRLNEWRCQASPMYGGDLRDSLTITDRCTKYNSYTGACLTLNQAMNRVKPWEYGTFLQECTRQPIDYVNQLKEVIERYVFCVPAVSAPQPTYRVLNPSQDKYWREQRDMYTLQRELSPKAALLHPIASAMITQFPDPRLIQYDCGKLQLLDRLLRNLKVEGHRVLIFTQMTRMLDILEAFLNFHGHIYLRLDGTTKVDQRQVLMERFNGDKRIFVFILSTRSGGVGVNLTGADTVIFYDSDWNPTMDAQAQDRCHRIGQTRDVHIYRLVSEKTIEENILKKANQKRMLGDLAIEGGNFTTAYFKSSTIQDLFNIDATLEDASQRMDIQSQSKSQPETSQGPSDERQALGALESALAACEDDQDVQAARTAKAEAVADLAEFDESIPLEDTGNTAEKEEMSKAEMEVQNLIKQLTPVERYAMRFMEETEAAWSAEQLAAAEREIEAQKREWEEKRLAEIRREEERRKASLEEDSEMLTFSRDDSTNQVRTNKNSNNKNPNKKLLNKSASKKPAIIHNNQPIRQTRNRTLSEKLETGIPEIKRTKKRLNSIDSSSSDMKKLNIDARKTRKSLPQTSQNDQNSPKAEPITKTPNRRKIRQNTSPNHKSKELKQELIDENEEQNSPKAVQTDSKINHEVDIIDIEKDFDEILEKSVIKKFNSPETPIKITKLSTPKVKNDENLPNNDLVNNHLNLGDSSSNSSDDIPLKSLTVKVNTMNKIDESSPRTRSRGTVKINLWTLDVSPILPGVKPIRNNNLPNLPITKSSKKILKDAIRVHSESPHDQKLIENCIKNEVSVLVTNITEQSLDKSDINDMVENSIRSPKNDLISPKNENIKISNKPCRRIKGLKKYIQKSTLDSWLKPNNLKRKNSDSHEGIAAKICKSDNESTLLNADQSFDNSILTQNDGTCSENSILIESQNESQLSNKSQQSKDTSNILQVIKLSDELQLLNNESQLPNKESEMSNKSKLSKSQILNKSQTLKDDSNLTQETQLSNESQLSHESQLSNNEAQLSGNEAQPSNNDTHASNKIQLLKESNLRKESQLLNKTQLSLESHLSKESKLQKVSQLSKGSKVSKNGSKLSNKFQLSKKDAKVSQLSKDCESELSKTQSTTLENECQLSDVSKLLNNDSNLSKSQSQGDLKNDSDCPGIETSKFYGSSTKKLNKGILNSQIGPQSEENKSTDQNIDSKHSKFQNNEFKSLSESLKEKLEKALKSRSAVNSQQKLIKSNKNSIKDESPEPKLEKSLENPNLNSQNNSELDIFDAALICELENTSGSNCEAKRGNSDSEISQKSNKNVSKKSLSDSETNRNADTRRSRRISTNLDSKNPAEKISRPPELIKSIVKLTRIDEIINEECPLKKSKQITRLVNYSDSSESENSTDSTGTFSQPKKVPKSSSDSDSDLETLQKIKDKLSDIEKRSTRSTKRVDEKSDGTVT